jgi:hypothetical protein
MTGVQPACVWKLLKRNNVQLRNLKEASINKKKAGRANPARYWLGKEQPPEMVESRVSKIRGEKHYLWKGGKDKRQYRNLIVKELCDICGSKDNLGIHHKDLDHYNDNPDNLQVLCVSCHLSLHKKLYWDAIHSGETPPKSNGIVGWDKE